MARVNIGYVGCGFMAQKVHIPNFQAIPDCQVLALAEVRQELGKQVQGEWEFQALYGPPGDARGFGNRRYCRIGGILSSG